MNSRDYQLRLYRGNLKCGGSYEQFELSYGDNVLLANAFNADDKWTLKVYENGTYSGTMTRISHYCAAPAVGSPTKPSNKSSQDWWAIGYHIGILGRGHTGGNRANHLCDGWNMYKYTLKDPTAKIRVEATDRFGKTYIATEVVGDYDYSLMEL
ncbi:MAG: calcineurin-like phosphoesterase C-terminal domain-containing protein, partial [Alistipes sp.]|nr:calcineurin-like phosphoesterase C-terminal domain-containing protein [Alistipes sp.]